jgi:hypothetical protein
MASGIMFFCRKRFFPKGGESKNSFFLGAECAPNPPRGDKFTNHCGIKRCDGVLVLAGKPGGPRRKQPPGHLNHYAGRTCGDDRAKNNDYC